MSKTFSFKAEVWKYKFDGATAWHFVTLPRDVSDEIKFLATDKKSPWGSLRVSARVGKTAWKTSLFPDSKSGCYFLPVKADVRKAEGLIHGSTVSCAITPAL